MSERVSTGVTELDKQLGGGLPPGAIVTVETESRSQAELFFHELLGGGPSAYLSTIGDVETVDAELLKSPVETGCVRTGYVHGSEVVQDAWSFIEEVTCTASSSGEGRGEGEGGVGVVVLSAVSDLEGSAFGVGREEFQSFLNRVQARLRETGCVLVLHRIVDSASGDGCGFVTDSVSDVILEFEQDVDACSVRDFLHMPKCRGGSALDERLKMKFSGSGLKIDTSRDIA